MRNALYRAAMLATLAVSAGAGLASGQTSPATTIEPKPGEGVLCLWALISVASEVGRHCPGKGDPGFQSALEESVAALDRYVAANGDASAATIDEFKRRQGGVGQSTARLCVPDAVELYDHLRAQGATTVRDSISKLVARPGTPAWGDCL